MELLVKKNAKLYLIYFSGYITLCTERTSAKLLLKISVSLDFVRFSLVETDRRFRDANSGQSPS
jgi:hypothetical protein